MSMVETLALVKPTMALESECLAMIEELAAFGEERSFDRYALARRDFREYVQALEASAQGIDLPPGLVPQTTLLLVKEGKLVVGQTRLRHTLTPQLEDYGGHIGYSIRPSQRRKGYGKRQLALALDKARGLGLNRVLVTCDMDNIASAHIIESNGGTLASQGVSNVSGKMISRYWIELL